MTNKSKHRAGRDSKFGVRAKELFARHFVFATFGGWSAVTLNSLALSFTLFALSFNASAQTVNVIYSFAGEEDGEYTDTDLVMDNNGNLYGTSVLGGHYGSGTVFQLARSGNTWIHNVLYSFTGGLDGGEPYKGVTLDAQGNIYGTAVTGGAGSCEGGCGVAYKLSHSGGTWQQTVIHYFSGGDDGSGPGTGLTIDSQGNLYGVTPTGGVNGLGVIFQLSPAGGNWRFKVIHAFTGGRDGASGSAGRLLLHAGHFYGVATTGGAYGKGTAFELARGTTGAWRLKTLYAFRGQPDAGFPYGGLVLDPSGNLFGTTYYDGANNLGSVYKLFRDVTGTWRESVLYSFQGGTDGQNSLSNLVMDSAGNLYGTTSEGGATCSCGTIFKLTPGQGGTWMESVIHRFQGPPDGSFPYNGMVGDGAGNFYGPTVHGGSGDDGSIYQFTPN